MSSDENATLAIWHSLWVNLKHTIHIKRQDTPRGVDTQGHNSQAHPGGAQQRDETAHHPPTTPCGTRMSKESTGCASWETGARDAACAGARSTLKASSRTATASSAMLLRV